MIYRGTGNSSNGSNDFEKIKMREIIDQLNRKLDKKRSKCKALDLENSFYHEITTVFLTLKKVMEKEKKYCYMMATDNDVLRKSQYMEGIANCGDITA